MLTLGPPAATDHQTILEQTPDSKAASPPTALAALLPPPACHPPATDSRERQSGRASRGPGGTWPAPPHSSSPPALGLPRRCETPGLCWPAPQRSKQG